jgi:hypothetical protein
MSRSDSHVSTSNDRLVSIVAPVLLTVVLAPVLFVIEGHIGFDIADEGFLWYGAQRVLVGEVPIRDFMAYDPGRYYWCAAVMCPLGNDGIISLRIASALFAALGFYLALSLLARSKSRSDPVLLFIAASIFALWMFPRHKVFDIAVSIGFVAAFTRLAERPSASRYFMTGLLVGLAGFFGRNHALYGTVGSVGLIAYLNFAPTPLKPVRASAFWAAGACVGSLPLLSMLVGIPGFAPAYWDGIRALFDQPCTLPLPVPWPWRVPVLELSWREAAHELLIGLYFMGLVAFGVLGVAYVIRAKRRGASVSPALVGSAFLVLPYAHVAFSRAELSHLAQAMFPALIGALTLIAGHSRAIRLSAAGLFLSTGLVVMLPAHPGFQAAREGNWVDAKVGASILRVAPPTADVLTMVRSLADEYAPHGRAFIAAPLWPGAYAVLERKAPMWAIYTLFPRSESFQKAEIARIQRAQPGFALIVDFPLDGRDDLRFRNIYPLVDRYIRDTFVPVMDPRRAPAYQLYKQPVPTGLSNVIPQLWGVSYSCHVQRIHELR